MVDTSKVYTRERYAPQRIDGPPPLAPGWEGEADAPAPFKITATPFVWRDPRTIPPRRWIYGRHLIRRFLSTTVAPGAVGKSSLTMTDGIALATGRNLLGTQPMEGPLRVWMWNGEDPIEELERRIAAICLHYGIKPKELTGQLFLNSGRDTEIIVATSTRTGTVIAQPVVDAMTATIRENKIDVVILDPFVSTHRVSENDNMAINAVAKSLASIADATNTAFELVHHVRKGHGQEITVEDGRGAVALLAAARSARVLNPMSKEEGTSAGIEKPRSYFRADNGKANLAPPPDSSEWYRLTPVSLDNGGDNGQPDHVGVVTSWKWPDPQENVTAQHLRDVQAAIAAGRWRENHQANDWVGHAIGRVLGLDPANKSHKAKIIGNIKVWLATGMLAIVTAKDEKGNNRPFIEVGKWATD